MDLPYVVNQWWAAVCSAKQLSPHYLGLMSARLPSQPLPLLLSIARLRPDPTKRKPLGGLLRPTLAVARLTCDAQGKIFELWAREFGIAYYPWRTPHRSTSRTLVGKSARQGSNSSKHTASTSWWKSSKA